MFSKRPSRNKNLGTKRMGQSFDVIWNITQLYNWILVSQEHNCIVCDLQCVNCSIGFAFELYVVTLVHCASAMRNPLNVDAKEKVLFVEKLSHVHNWS